MPFSASRFVVRVVLGSVVAFAGAMTAGCKGGRDAAPETRIPTSGTASAEAPRWARAFEWTREGEAVSLTVTLPWKDARAPLRYTLLPQGAPAPAKGEAVRVPAKRIVCLAAAHVGFLRALEATDALVGVDAANHVYDDALRARLAAGSIFEAGTGSQLNIERLLVEKPDLVVANAVGVAENETLDRLRRAGIPVLVTAEWMENHPLARAEWLRVFGALLGREARADSLFDAIERAYRALADSAAGLERRPTVLLGAPFRDQWFVSGGRSYMARFFADAGADYLWKDDTTAGGVSQSFESVLARARDADVWLYPGDWSNHWNTLADGRRLDARYAAFKAFREARVYNNDARRLADGANDYWESGIVNPHRMLADLVAIFHGNPERPESLFYHRRLPRGP